MTPPRCYFCGRDHDDLPTEQFKIVRFAPTEKDLEWLASGRVGRPPNAQWFCLDHAHLAEERAHLHANEALAEIRALKESG